MSIRQRNTIPTTRGGWKGGCPAQTAQVLLCPACARVELRPTPAGGAPVVTFLGNAAKCASAAHDSVETVVEDDVELGMVVWSPSINNACNGPVDMSEDTLEIYATEDRTGAPVFTVVNAGSTRIGGTAGERTCGGCGCGRSMGFQGPFPLEFSPEQVAFRVTLESDAPIAVTPGCRP